MSNKTIKGIEDLQFIPNSNEITGICQISGYSFHASRNYYHIIEALGVVVCPEEAKIEIKKSSFLSRILKYYFKKTKSR